MRSRSYVTLDGLRGIAALSVVVFHANRLIGDMSLIAFCLFLDQAYDKRARKWLATTLARRPRDVEREGVTQAP